jgi:hypothetical protein
VSEMGYAYLGYAVTLAVLGGYAIRMLVRGRKLSRSLPPGERTWR